MAPNTTPVTTSVVNTCDPEQMAIYILGMKAGQFKQPDMLGEVTYYEDATNNPQKVLWAVSDQRPPTLSAFSVLGYYPEAKFSYEKMLDAVPGLCNELTFRNAMMFQNIFRRGWVDGSNYAKSSIFGGAIINGGGLRGDPLPYFNSSLLPRPGATDSSVEASARALARNTYDVFLRYITFAVSNTRHTCQYLNETSYSFQVTLKRTARAARLAGVSEKDFARDTSGIINNLLRGMQLSILAEGTEVAGNYNSVLRDCSNALYSAADLAGITSAEIDARLGENLFWNVPIGS